MATSRGSKHKLVMIPEATFGTTPATPAMLETPVNTFQPTINQTIITSDQIRGHPFVDKQMQGAVLTDITVTAELQKTNLDTLIQMALGVAFSAGSAKVVDALYSATLESQHLDATPLYDVYTGACCKQMQINFQAAANAKVSVQFDLMAKAATLDNAATISGETITAATSTNPFVFGEAAMTLNSVSTPVTAATLTLARQIDPLYVLGAVQPDEYIPSSVTLSGTVTIPLRSNAQSGLFTGFTSVPLVLSATHPASGGSFTFTIPNINLGKAQRPIQNRGAILQTYDWSAAYDTGSSTVMTVAKT